MWARCGSKTFTAAQAPGAPHGVIVPDYVYRQKQKLRWEAVKWCSPSAQLVSTGAQIPAQAV